MTGKARIIELQREEINRLDARLERQAKTIADLQAESERWRKAYSVLMDSIYLMTLPVEPGSDAQIAQQHTRDQMSALATEYRKFVGAI